MKKQALKSFKLLFAFIGLLSAVLPAFAHDFEVDGIYYNIDSTTDLTVSVTYKGTSDSDYTNEYSGAVAIPKTVTFGGTEYSVTSIGYNAFKGCDGLASVTIPEGVTSIGNTAFYECTELTSVTIPEGVTSIGNNVFKGCSGLTEVVFNAKNCNRSSYEPIFEGCNSLVKITIGENVQSIPHCAFMGCTGLTSVTIPGNITSIGIYAFHGCTGLTEVVFNAENCTTIGGIYTPAFAFCSSLQKITIGENVQRFPNVAYYGWDKLTEVVFNAKNCTTMGSANYPVFDSCSSLQKITIGENVQCIPDYAFYGCDGLTSVTIPSNATIIGQTAFEGCTNLVTTWIETITQTTLKIWITPTNSDYNGFVSCKNSYIDSKNYICTISDLEPNTEYSYDYGLKINGNYCNISSATATTSAFTTSVSGTANVSSITAQGSYTEGDITILAEGLNLNSAVEEYDNENNKTFTNLDPNTAYTVYYSVETKEGGVYTANKTFTTEALTWSDGEYQATSTTSARLMNTTNCGATEGTGFEWRRYGAPENLKPNVVTCPVVDGMVIGSLRGLNPDVYYEFRPYYTSASGNTYYGEWAALITGDANVYFEPEVRTYNDFLVSANNVTLKGYALAGTDDITSQGFEYWKPVTQTASMVSPYSENDVKKVEASGISMTITIGNLEYATTYCYRAFVTTAKGTVYGDTMQFTTEADVLTGIEEIIAPENDTEEPVEYYNLQGTRVMNPEKGIYIKRQGNKTTKIIL